MRVIDAFDALDKDSKGFLTEFEVIVKAYLLFLLLVQRLLRSTPFLRNKRRAKTLSR